MFQRSLRHLAVGLILFGAATGAWADQAPELTLPEPSISGDVSPSPDLIAPPAVPLPSLSPTGLPPRLALPPLKAVRGKPPHIAKRPSAIARKPSLTERPVQYGTSVQGRPLTALILDNGAHPSANTTLIFGGFHGDERSTPAVIANLRSFLRRNPSRWQGRVILVPCANPDGWQARTRVNARGVDLNRNFPAGWRCAAPADRYRPGPHAASEPETRAMMALIRRYKPAKVVSLHSPLHCLNPTGSLGQAMAEAMHQFNHYPVRDDIGYPTPGSLGNYGGSLGIGVVTLELPVQSALSGWAANHEALLAAVRFPTHVRQVRDRAVKPRRGWPACGLVPARPWCRKAPS